MTYLYLSSAKVCSILASPLGWEDSRESTFITRSLALNHNETYKTNRLSKAQNLLYARMNANVSSQSEMSEHNSIVKKNLAEQVSSFLLMYIARYLSNKNHFIGTDI